MNKIKFDCHTPKVGDRVRLAIDFFGRWIPLCWLRVGRDSSIYLGLAFDKPVSGGFVGKRNEGKPIKFNYDDIEFSQDGYKSSRVSFKAKSGEIHYGEEIFQGRPIFPLIEPRQLGAIMFAHPNVVPPPQKKNNNDYDIAITSYELSRDHPLWGGVFVLPWDGVSTLEAFGPAENMVTSYSVLLGFKQRDVTKSIAVQLVLGHGPKGPWSKFPVFLLA